jgi:tRNA pseudouridine32 synthase/23S rRNA pseudouridine746 synthase
MPSQNEIHITVKDGEKTVVELLAEAAGLSRQRIKQVMQKGAVWMGSGKKVRRLRRANKRPKVGDELHLYYDEKVLAEVPSPAQLISDEGEYSVWYKPCGLRSQGSKWGDHCTINRWVEQNLQPQRPAFIVHRLDRAATGLIIIAHQKRIAAAFAKLFQERAIEKRYRVIVHGQFPDTPHPLKITTDIDGRQASSQVSLLEYDADGNRSLLEVNIETGRKHQIRRHLSEFGFPVVGDRLYGCCEGSADEQKSDEEDLQLTACFLAFQCPVKQQPVQFILAESLIPNL